MVVEEAEKELQRKLQGKTFTLRDDPFDTGFEFNEKTDTDAVIRYYTDKDEFLPGDDPDAKHYPPVIWKAHCKAAIKNKWFSAPNWKISDVGKWPIAQTFWLYNWIVLKTQEMLVIPFD